MLCYCSTQQLRRTLHTYSRQTSQDLVFTLALTVVAGDVEVALVELAEATELHIGLVSPVNLARQPTQPSQRERRNECRWGAATRSSRVHQKDTLQYSRTTAA